jgi:exopolysaccharide biosynthesis protein
MAVGLLLAALLPLAPVPAAPFPKILTDAPVITSIAPGVEYGDYEMRTSDGPLSIHVVAIGANERQVRIGTALANERLVSGGETLSSMAARSGAIAGINGDYFDINQTNQPLNILIKDGTLVRMPMRRWAIAFDARGRAQFGEFTVAERMDTKNGSIPLKTMNDWPPPGGGPVLLTPQYGALRAMPGVTLLRLRITSGAAPFCSYGVDGIESAETPHDAGYYLAFSEPVSANALPSIGDELSVEEISQPPITGLQSAIGGGPLLVKDGVWYADPDGPSRGEFATHMPASGIALTGQNRLLLFEIDGREPGRSIGVLQPQFAALMIAFGAVTGMQFDGGGSSTMVARLPGDAHARVQNSPSDGTERSIADALLVYEDAPTGPAAQIAGIPQTVRTFAGARVDVKFAELDAAGHTLCVTPACPGLRITALPDRIDASEGALHASVPVRRYVSPARIDILPHEPVAEPGQDVRLQARAFDAHGYEIALPAQLPWQARNGTIDTSGNFSAGPRDGTASLTLGQTYAQTTIVVGTHDALLDFAAAAHFATAPAGGPGALEADAACGCLRLGYDFTRNEHAAYANVRMALPPRALAIEADVHGDGNGETLRAALDNAIGERFLYTVAAIDWHGRRRVRLPVPTDLPQPVILRGLYVIDGVGSGPHVRRAGSIVIRDVRVVLAGGPQHEPK